MTTVRGECRAHGDFLELRSLLAVASLDVAFNSVLLARIRTGCRRQI